jgi:hypothetical protein
VLKGTRSEPRESGLACDTFVHSRENVCQVLQGSVDVEGSRAEAASDRTRGGQKPKASNRLGVKNRRPGVDCGTKTPA